MSSQDNTESSKPINEGALFSPEDSELGQRAVESIYKVTDDLIKYAKEHPILDSRIDQGKFYHNKEVHITRMLSDLEQLIDLWQEDIREEMGDDFSKVSGEVENELRRVKKILEVLVWYHDLVLEIGHKKGADFTDEFKSAMMLRQQLLKRIPRESFSSKEMVALLEIIEIIISSTEVSIEKDGRIKQAIGENKYGVLLATLDVAYAAFAPDVGSFAIGMACGIEEGWLINDKYLQVYVASIPKYREGESEDFYAKPELEQERILAEKKEEVLEKFKAFLADLGSEKNQDLYNSEYNDNSLRSLYEMAVKDHNIPPLLFISFVNSQIFFGTKQLTYSELLPNKLQEKMEALKQSKADRLNNASTACKELVDEDSRYS